ncbi:helix-turn-helix transcriptional regulator [Catenulispora rubra]|uniref:helix-turn-helix transcriptional regulator n=1 Tax=Catenulispora rubra TaxID=280293 RepID=UPI001892646E|nr:AAA family ATPase [Catenulispora rubra]
MERRNGVGTASTVHGRIAELHTIAQLVASTAAGPRAVLVTGEPGIGKSTLLEAGVGLAHENNLPTLTARGSLAGGQRSFGALVDLLRPLAEEDFAGLPEPQRFALNVALGRTEAEARPGAVGPREIAAGLLAVLRRLGPALIVVDDLPWLDLATLDALRFALRRIGEGRLRILASRRTSGAIEEPASYKAADDVLPAGTFQTLALGPVDRTTIKDLLLERHQLQLPVAVLSGVVKQTGGNPFWALEIGAALAQTPEIDGYLPIPPTLSSLVAGRLAKLPAEVVEALLVVAALPQPTPALAVRVLQTEVARPEAAIDDAVASGVVTAEGSHLRPAHPLLGSAALDGLTPERRRGLYRRLAASVTDPEQRARHLVRAVEAGPDSETAAAVDAGVAVAEGRGALASAAELAELAVGFTAPEDWEDLRRRRLAAARLTHRVGDMARAVRFARDVSDGADVDTTRKALALLVEATYWTEGPQAAQAVLRPHLTGPATDEHLRAVALSLAADCGDGLDTPRPELVRLALESFDRVGADADAVALCSALRYEVGVSLDSGRGIPEQVVVRIASLQGRAANQASWARLSVVLGFWRKAVDDLDGSRNALNAAIAQAQAEGDDAVLPTLFSHLAVTESWAGDLTAGRRAVADGLRLAAPGGVAPLTITAADGMLRVLTGDFDGARALIAEQRASGRGTIQPQGDIFYEHVLGLAALLEGDPEDAQTRLLHAYHLAQGADILEPGRRQRLEPDLGQALVATGNLDAAAELAAEQRELGERMRRPTLIGIAHRLDGSVFAARDDLDGAITALRLAVAAHEQSPLRLELGRSLLALGDAYRRRRAKSEAQPVLQAAVELFTTAGAAPFAAQAQAELDRVQRSRTGDVLTATETTVAELVAGGLSNREVAEQLVTSVRTVEGHLGSIYRKLGVRSRTELARRLAPGRT